MQYLSWKKDVKNGRRKCRNFIYLNQHLIKNTPNTLHQNLNYPQIILIQYPLRLHRKNILKIKFKFLIGGYLEDIYKMIQTSLSDFVREEGEGYKEIR